MVWRTGAQDLAVSWRVIWQGLRAQYFSFLSWLITRQKKNAMVTRWSPNDKNEFISQDVSRVGPVKIHASAPSRDTQISHDFSVWDIHNGLWTKYFLNLGSIVNMEKRKTYLAGNGHIAAHSLQKADGAFWSLLMSPHIDVLQVTSSAAKQEHHSRNKKASVPIIINLILFKVHLKLQITCRCQAPSELWSQNHSAGKCLL